jgi:hypothetical protein
MSLTRRRFIKSVGVTLASLVVTRTLSACTSQSSGSGSQQQELSAWDQLRLCWFELSALKDVSPGADWEKVQAQVDEQKAAHRAALAELVEAGELDRAVAEQVELAFAEAVGHVERSLATCYEAIPFEHGVRADLLQQTDALHQAADELDLDPAVVEQAQAAIARDVAFFEAVKIGKVGRQQIEQRFRANELDASPEAVEAARILVELLLGKP